MPLPSRMAKWHMSFPPSRRASVLRRAVSIGVAGAHPDYAAVAGDDQADAVGAVQGLAEGVGVPVGPRAGGEWS